VKGHLWISADIALEAHRYFLHEGKWYEIGATHLEAIRNQVADLLSGAPSVLLPPWEPRFTREDEYNKDAVKHGFTLLDKKELHTTQHPYGIEACDLVGPNGEFIHVKAPTGSSELSHLFHQALTSYDALRYDPDAREKLSDRVAAARPGITVSAQPKVVIFAIALKRKAKGQPATYRPLTIDTLFTFSQVSLVHAVRMFELAQVKVEVVDISPHS
jgi:uncharacterized protein (TIGR04141 family)